MSPGRSFKLVVLQVSASWWAGAEPHALGYCENHPRHFIEVVRKLPAWEVEERQYSPLEATCSLAWDEIFSIQSPPLIIWLLQLNSCKPVSLSVVGKQSHCGRWEERCEGSMEFGQCSTGVPSVRVQLLPARAVAHGRFIPLRPLFWGRFSPLYSRESRSLASDPSQPMRALGWGRTKPQAVDTPHS